MLLSTAGTSVNNYTGQGVQPVVQAQLAANLTNSTLVLGNANAVPDTLGTGNWKFYVAGNTSAEAITSESASTEWTVGSQLIYNNNGSTILNYSFNPSSQSGSTIKNLETTDYGLTLMNGATINPRVMYSTYNGAGSYVFNGQQLNPTLTFHRGYTYRIVTGHVNFPMFIQTVPSPYSIGNVYNTGVTNNGTGTLVITIVVTNDTPSTLYYVSSASTTTTGTINIVSGEPDTALSLNVSSGQYVTSSVPFTMTTSWTISFWYQFTGTFDGSPTIFEIGNTNGFGLRISGNNSTRAIESYQNGTVFSSQSYANSNNPYWNYYTLVYNNGSFTGYFNATTSVTFQGSPQLNVISNYTYINFGKSNMSSVTNPTTGTRTIEIDKFQVFTSALSLSDITAIYNDTYVLPSRIKDIVTGATWVPTPATVVNTSETSYTVKSTEIALNPGTNSTYAVWTAPKTTNIRIDVSFADYHTRSTGVGFQMFKINADDTFGSTIFPRTVTGNALTNANSSNYLSVPSRTLSVSQGDKIFYRIDANGNTVTASSVLATNIYTDSNYVPVPNSTNINETQILQARLATNLNSTTLVSGNVNTIYDTVGTGDWKFYVAGNTSVAAISSASNSSEWTGGSILPYVISPTVPTDMSFCFNFNSNTVSGTTVSDSTGNYTGTLVNGATIGTDGSPAPGGGYLSLTKASGHYFNFPPTSVTAAGFTISMWFRATSNNVTFARLFDMWSSSNFSMFINTSPEGIGLQNGANNRYIYTGTVIDNAWRHITLTIDYAGASGASSVYKCYINGTLQTTTTAAYPVLGFRTSYNLGTAFNFGNGGAESFDGGLDDFRLYHRAINATEVSLIYSQASIYYPFELADISLSATKIGDLATGSYVYNGTLVGSASIAVNGNSRVSGKGHLSLSRTATYFKFAPVSVLNTGLTISFWGRFASSTPLNGSRIFDMRDPEISLWRGGSISFYLYVAGVGNVFNSPNGMFDNVWRHFTITIAYGGVGGASSSYILYTNASAVRSATLAYPALGTRNTCNLGSNADTGTFCIDGGIDDFRIFQRVLSATEVAALYAGPLPPALKDTVTGANWTSKPAILLDDIETSYTVKSNEIALKPGTNSTYAIWTSPKTTNIRVDVSFADYHSRSNGVGFQMFKINADNTFGSTIFPRTVTSAVLTDSSANYLTVPSRSLSVVAGDKLVYRIDGNGNPTSSSSVLATNIYSYSGIWN
jgi:hypothetical protein